MKLPTMSAKRHNALTDNFYKAQIEGFAQRPVEEQNKIAASIMAWGNAVRAVQESPMPNTPDQGDQR
jgi:hypothetical protein